jgi:DNA-binding beta-propeller fold protein YncE
MGIAVDAVDSNSVWVADTDNHRVMRFRVNNGDWALVSQLGSTQESGDSNLMFNSPNRVATRGSLLFVLDKFNHRVQVFNSSTSKYLRTIGSGREGTGDGDLNYPNNFHVSDNGMVYISEASQFRISIFKVTGEFVGYFAGARGSTDKNSVMAAISGVFHDQATDTVFASDDRFNGKHGRITVWKLKESPLSEIVAME